MLDKIDLDNFSRKAKSLRILSQPAFTCSKLNGVVLVSLLSTLNVFHTLFLFSIVSFQDVIAGWDLKNKA